MRKLISIITILLLLTAPTWAGPRIIQGGNAPPPASETVSGIIELATDAETVTGSATGVVTTPANITARLATPGSIGSTTPAAVYATPAINKGPAIVTSFAGTVSTSGSSTTITWSSAADAILAGYNATNPVLGTTIITGAIKQASVTRYIVSWTNSTTCVVDSACTLAASTELTSVQLPIATFVDSASPGVTKGWMNAAGNVYFVGSMKTTGSIEITGGYAFSALDNTNFGMTRSGNDTVLAAYGNLQFNVWNAGHDTAVKITTASNILTGGLGAAGTSAAKVLAIGAGTMPTTLVADAVQMGVAEYNGATGDQRLNIYSESTVAKKTAIGSGTVSINGAVTSGGGITRQLAEATSGALSGASGSIAVNVPSGARILGVQLRVDTLITSSDGGTSWTAVYVNTPTTAICATQALDKDTKFSAIHPAYEITTGTVTITLTMNAGKLFSAGNVRGIVYYEAIDTMIAAP